MPSLVLLDTRPQLIRVALVSVGLLDAAIVDSPEMFYEAVLASAAAMVLFHNHPSDDPTAGADTLSLTARLMRVGKVLGIEMVDPVILADQRYCSLLKAGRLGPRAGCRI